MQILKGEGDKAGADADFKRAQRSWTRGIGEESGPDSENKSNADLVERGAEKGKKGDLDGAIADFDRAIELDLEKRGRLLQPRDTPNG